MFPHRWMFTCPRVEHKIKRILNFENILSRERPEGVLTTAGVVLRQDTDGDTKG